MTTKLLLGIRLTPFEKMTVIKLNDIDLMDRVESLRNETAAQISLPNNSFDLIYCGCLMKNDATMESYGLKSGSMIHVLKKQETKELKSINSTPTNTPENIEFLMKEFKSFAENPLLKFTMRRVIKRPEFIENIISSSPELAEDAVATAILQDPDLIAYFTNAETIKRISKLHPALLEAAQHIASAVQDEAHILATSASSVYISAIANATLGDSYSLENLSDDEEMADSSESSDSTQPSNGADLSRNQSHSTISAAQLFAAIPGARQSTSRGNSNVDDNLLPLSSISRPNSNNEGVITFEMFNQAIQQAFAFNPVTNDSTNSTQSSPSTTFNGPQNSSIVTDMQRQITIMHEMGLENDAINVQALQITNGDVQAAIELVLNGFVDN